MIMLFQNIAGFHLAFLLIEDIQYIALICLMILLTFYFVLDQINNGNDIPV